jgi:hypothetical protein
MKKTTRVAIVLSEDEAQELADAAKAKSLSLSSWIRSTLLDLVRRHAA